MSARDVLLAKIQAQCEEDSQIPPAVALDEYFSGNTDEECIARNQVGYGRPTLAELYARFREMAAFLLFPLTPQVRLHRTFACVKHLTRT